MDPHSQLRLLYEACGVGHTEPYSKKAVFTQIGGHEKLRCWRICGRLVCGIRSEMNLSRRADSLNHRE